MKILFEIDQIASIENGCDAPNSTEMIEIPAEEIPFTLRKQITQIGGWTPQRKRVEVNGKLPRVTKPVTTKDALAALQSLFNFN